MVHGSLYRWDFVASLGVCSSWSMHSFTWRSVSQGFLFAHASACIRVLLQMIIVGQQLQFLGNRVLFQFISVLQRSRRGISLAGGVIFPHKLPAQAIPIAPAFAHCFFIFWDTHRSGSQHPFPCLRSLIDGKTKNTKCSQFNLPRGAPTRLGGRVGAHITCLSVCKCFVGYTQHYLTILRTMVRFVGGCCSDRAMQCTCHR